MSLNKKTAKSLAVAYAAWQEAVKEDDSTGIIAWGGSLLAAQEATGVSLVDVKNTERMIKLHRPLFREAM